MPTADPVASPSDVPSKRPSAAPTYTPSASPTLTPSTHPSKTPTSTPSTHAPTEIPEYEVYMSIRIPHIYTVMPNNEKDAFLKTFQKFLDDTHCFSLNEGVTFDDVFLLRQHIMADTGLIIDLKVEGTRSAQLTTAELKKRLIDCTALNYDSLTVSLYEFSSLSPEVAREGITGTFALIVAGTLGGFALLLTTTIYFISSKRRSEKRLEEVVNNDDMLESNLFRFDHIEQSRSISNSHFEENEINIKSENSSNSKNDADEKERILLAKDGEDSNDENDIIISNVYECNMSKKVEVVIGNLYVHNDNNGRRKPSTEERRSQEEPSYEEVISNPREPSLETNIEEARSQEEPSSEEVSSNPREPSLEANIEEARSQEEPSFEEKSFKMIRGEEDEESNDQNTRFKDDENDLSHQILTDDESNHQHSYQYNDECEGEESNHDVLGKESPGPFCFKPSNQIAFEDESNHHQYSCHNRSEIDECEQNDNDDVISKDSIHTSSVYKPYTQMAPDDESNFEPKKICHVIFESRSETCNHQEQKSELGENRYLIDEDDENYQCDNYFKNKKKKCKNDTLKIEQKEWFPDEENHQEQSRCEIEYEIKTKEVQGLYKKKYPEEGRETSPVEYVECEVDNHEIGRSPSKRFPVDYVACNVENKMTDNHITRSKRTTDESRNSGINGNLRARKLGSMSHSSNCKQEESKSYNAESNQSSNNTQSVSLFEMLSADIIITFLL
jgi:hypothetical protein